MGEKILEKPTKKQLEEAMALLEDVDRATALRPARERHALRRALDSVVEAKQLRASTVVSPRADGDGS